MRLLLFTIIAFGQPKYIECSSSISIITNPQGSDGFGAQFLLIIASVIYAELNNMKYVYTPFKTMEHNYDNDPNFIAKKEWLINFINNFEINQTNDAIVPSNVIDIFYFEKNLIGIANCFSLQKIKNIFRLNKNLHNYFNNENLNIAVHIRRPNPHDNRIYGTDTPDTVFLNIINTLRVVYSSQNPLFHIYSQGNIEQFEAFSAQDVVFHLNKSVEDSFTSMVLADVLVISPSTFSYTAGLLSKGIVYYIPFVCARLPHWIPIDTLPT